MSALLGFLYIFFGILVFSVVVSAGVPWLIYVVDQVKSRRNDPDDVGEDPDEHDPEFTNAALCGNDDQASGQQPDKYADMEDVSPSQIDRARARIAAKQGAIQFTIND